MFIDFNQIARIGKIVALLGFFLPWITVSCSNTEILTATGWQLMTGDPQPAGPLANMENQNRTDDAEPAVIIIAAFAVILIGLGTSLLTRAQTAAISMLVCAILGIGISYYGVENLRTELQSEITESQNEGRGDLENTPFFGSEPQSDFQRAIAAQVEVREEKGYVVTLGGLLLAAIFSLLTLFRKRKLEGGAELAQ